MNFGNDLDLNDQAGFYVVNFEVFCQTMQETLLTDSIDLGGITIHRGKRQGHTIWMVDNPSGLHEYHYPIWVESNELGLLS
jgi:hypothetical protein